MAESTGPIDPTLDSMIPDHEGRGGRIQQKSRSSRVPREQSNLKATRASRKRLNPAVGHEEVTASPQEGLSVVKEYDGPYYFMQKTMNPNRLPSTLEGQSETAPPPDFWSRPIANFQTLEQAQLAFDHPKLLHSFFAKMDEILNLVENNSATSNFSTSLARQMIDCCTATIYCYGESGSGKSTLVRNLTKDPSAVTSHTKPGTECDVHCRFQSGLRFIDTRGFRVPLVPESTLGVLNAEWLKEYLQWNRLLSTLRQRIDSQVATDRPLAIMYCHKAGHRVVAERIKQLVRIGHMRMIPTFIVITDVYSIDDSALCEFRQVFRKVVREVGFNARGKSVHLIEVNSQAKEVKGHHFEPVGMPQLASMILNALEPMDILTFTRRSFFGLGQHQEGRRKKRPRAAPFPEPQTEMP